MESHLGEVNGSDRWHVEVSREFHTVAGEVQVHRTYIENETGGEGLQSQARPVDGAIARFDEFVSSLPESMHARELWDDVITRRLVDNRAWTFQARHRYEAGYVDKEQDCVGGGLLTVCEPNVVSVDARTGQFETVVGAPSFLQAFDDTGLKP